MKIKEARNKLQENRRLIGTIFEGDKISVLIIIPSDKSNFSQIISCVNFGTNYEKHLLGYTDFEIIALMNFEQYPIEGIVFTHPLNRILKQLSEK